MNSSHFPAFYQIQKNKLLKGGKDNFWMTLLQSAGVFLFISFIVFFVVNYQYLFIQFSDFYKQKTNLVDYNAYFNDTDNDGILDWWEKENNLDVNRNDASLDNDSDGADNLTEYIFGTNPNIADTDSDGYLDGEELEYKYFPSGSGRVDQDSDGIYDWWEIKFGFDDENKSDANLDEDKDGLNNLEEFICQTNPSSKDSDNDGRIDSREVNCVEALTNYPIFDEDDDKDGLSFNEEKFFGTDPQKFDTDEDGFDDYTELTRGYNPLGEGKIKADLVIPIINLRAPIVWSESLETDDLVKDMREGIIHHPATTFPGLRGNAFFTGHSSYYLLDPGNYKDVLEDIDKISKDDEIIVELEISGNKKEIIYKVGYWKIVSPEDSLIFRDFEGSELTLATCWPIGNSENRYMIKAFLVSDK